MGSVAEPRVPLSPGDRAIDEWRPIKIICIGAGMSGIGVGAMIPAQIPNSELVIYEKNEEVGGGWFENHYPGLQPDLTPHAYQYTFASNPRWSRYYPGGTEFKNYLRVVAKKFGVYEKTKFRHQFKQARWIEEDGQWEVEVLRLDDNTVIKDRAEVFLKCMGLVNDWKFPDIQGLEDYQGKLMHTARWDDAFDPTDKTVAVIGYGATGVQIMPALQPLVKHLDHYIRGQFWTAPSSGAKFSGAVQNVEYTPEQIENFTKDPLSYLQYRKEIERSIHSFQAGLIKGTEANRQLELAIRENMETILSLKPGLFAKVRPDYPAGCRRLVMGQRWLEAIVKPNADLVTGEIRRFTKEGIEDAAGNIRQYDAIICATGFQTKLDDAKTPIYGQGGITLAEVWDPEPVAYLSVAPPKMPNFYQIFGPNSAPVAGSISHTIEGAIGYAIKCIKKIQRQYIKSMVPSDRAINDWMNHVDYWSSKTVMSENCRTWFKRNISQGRVIINWPGSSMHAYHGWRDPRWEDYDYESWLPKHQSLRWLGSGMTYAEQNGQDATDYMSFTDVSSVLTLEDFLALEAI